MLSLCCRTTSFSPIFVHPLKRVGFRDHFSKTQNSRFFSWQLNSYPNYLQVDTYYETKNPGINQGFVHYLLRSFVFGGWYWYNKSIIIL